MRAIEALKILVPVRTALTFVFSSVLNEELEGMVVNSLGRLCLGGCKKLTQSNVELRINVESGVSDLLATWDGYPHKPVSISAPATSGPSSHIYKGMGKNFLG